MIASSVGKILRAANSVPCAILYLPFPLVSWHLIQRFCLTTSCHWAALSALPSHRYSFLLHQFFFALWCSVNRLRDFRLTTQIARRREKDETDLQVLRDEAKSLGNFTWGLFWFQVASFGLGAGCGAIAVVIQVWPR
jgi:hypothetical protein